jgi:uncharacterized 2Fe-2S/4Fe-4S cluster protein (DUF4445 family)
VGKIGFFKKAKLLRGSKSQRMSPKRYEITLLASGRSIHAIEGETLLQVLAQAGIQLRSECGGQGACGKCLVAIQEGPGTQTHDPVGTDADSRSSRLEQYLACQWEVRRNLVIEIPFGSLSPAEVITKPTFVRRFGPVMTARTRAVSRGRYGLAVDLGTTTIAYFLCDLDQGRLLASGSMRNPQLIFGDDVMSRIRSVASDLANLARMRELVVAALNDAVSSLAGLRGLKTDGIVNIVVVGNPCMIHLFFGMDPSSIGTYPYLPAFTGGLQSTAAEVGLLGLHPEARVQTLPLISGFLGCDIVAAAMASDLDIRDNGTLLLDVGTNGEVMLNVRGELSAASCATGPALEGAAISHGMHAVSGAVDAVRMEPVDAGVGYSLIQHNPDEPRKAVGICGSGIVSAIAALLKTGILLKSGRFNPQSRHPNLRRNSEGTVEFVLVPAAKTQAGVDITLTQKDVRAVQFAKGALLAGITLLCREGRLGLPQRLLAAGAFGTFLNKKDAMTIGMLPRLAENSVETIGNAAGEGAILAVLHKDSAKRAEDIAQRTRVIDLASHADFHKVFVDSLAFPDPREQGGP